MSDLRKLHNLPDLAPAPYSAVGGLVRRLIEYADWSVLPALVDELTEQQRWLDIQTLRHRMVLPPHGSIWQLNRDNWGSWAEDLVALFYFDLFDVNAVAAELGAVKWATAEESIKRALESQGLVNNNRRVVTLPHRPSDADFLSFLTGSSP